MKKVKFFIQYFVIIFAIYGVVEVAGGELFPEKKYIEIEVNEGETLWSIAKQYGKETSYSTQDFVDVIAEENLVFDGRIEAGQTLKIPVKTTVIAMGDTENDEN